MSVKSDPDQERRDRIKAILGEVQNLTSEIGTKAAEMSDLLTLDEAEVAEETEDVGPTPED